MPFPFKYDQKLSRFHNCLYLIAVIHKNEEKIKSGHDRSRHVQVMLQQQE